jgi:hypothetical protein
VRRARAAAAVLAAALGAAAPALAVTGDVTGDGVFDLRDPLALCRYLAGTLPSLPQPGNGDVNFDGTTDATDLDLMMQAVVGGTLPSAPLSVSPPNLDFGDVVVGDSATSDVTLSNGGAAPITVGSIALGPGTSAAFSIAAAPATPTVLGPGDSAVVTVRYAPSGTGADAGTLAVLSNAGSASVPLSGTGVSPGLSVSPLSLPFGDVAVGDAVQLGATITNTGTSDLTVTSIAPGPGTSADFMLTFAPATPATIPPGQQRMFAVQYAPSDIGDDAGSIEVLGDAGSAAVALTGRGVGPVLDVSPTSLGFGNVLVGGSSTASFTVTNTGSAPMEVASIMLGPATSADFTLGTVPAQPFSLPAGGSLVIEVTYAPTDVGPDAGKVEVHTDAGDAEVQLSGNGVVPDIAVTPQSVGFGNVLIGQEAAEPVTVQNVGTADLRVSSIGFAPGASAAITLRSLPSLPLVLPPGGSAGFEVVYQPAAVGADAASLEIASDDPDMPLTTVPVAGNGVSPALVIQPVSLDFGNVTVGQVQDLTFTITNSGGSDLTVNGVALGAGTSADFTLPSPPATPVTLGSGDMLTVTVRYAPAGAGAGAGTVEIDTSAGGGQVTLSGSGVAPEIDVAPAAVDFGNVRVGQSPSMMVTIRNVGSLTLNVSGIALGGAAPEIALSGVPALPAALPPGGSIAVTVAYAPLAAGSDADTLTITSDDADEPAVLVGVMGTGVEPVLSVTPAARDFGDVTIGFTASLGLTLRNTGTADLTITSVALGPGTSAEFSVGAPGSTLLAPGASTSVTVTYTPADTGDDTGSVEVASDGGSASVPLSGRGVVTVGVASLALSETMVSLGEGSCVQLRALATMTDSSVVDVTTAAVWASLDPNVAAAGGTGLVTGLAAGTTRVTAALGVHMAEADVTVVPPGTLRIALPCGEVAAGASFTAEVTADAGARPLGAYAIRLVYDPAVVRVTGIDGGLTGAFSGTPASNPADFGSGSTVFAAYQNGSLTGPSGVVSVARVTFEVIGAPGGGSAVSLSAATLAATDLSSIPWTNVPGRVQVTP